MHTRIRIFRSVRMRGLALKCLLLSVALVFAGLICEVSLRVARFSAPIFGSADPVMGTGLFPGACGWYSDEGNAWVAINSDGQRDIEHTIAKPRGCFRIAVLGDSYTEARQVELRDSFPKILEKELNQSRPEHISRVEVLNFGASGYGTASELLMLREKVWKYSPDLVILAFLTGNDVSDNSRTLSGRPTVPYFLLDDEGELRLDNSFLEHPSWARRRRLDRWGVRELVNRSRLLQLVNKVAHRPRSQPRRATEHEGDELGLDSTIYKEPESAEWNTAWRLTERLLLEMRRDVVAKNVSFAVVTLSNGVQVHPDPRVASAKAAACGVSDLLYPDRRVKTFCETNGIHVLTLAPVLSSYALQHDAFLHGFENTRLGDGHWNALGHRVAGKAMARAVPGWIGNNDDIAALTDERRGWR